MNGHGDLNNNYAARPITELKPDPAYHDVSFAIPKEEDDAEIRMRYRPFLLSEERVGDDWVAKLELSTALKIVEEEVLWKKRDRLRILVLYGSMRSRYVFFLFLPFDFFFFLLYFKILIMTDIDSFAVVDLFLACLLTRPRAFSFVLDAMFGSTILLVCLRRMT
jgi:hypothetical protein